MGERNRFRRRLFGLSPKQVNQHIEHLSQNHAILVRQLELQLVEASTRRDDYLVELKHYQEREQQITTALSSADVQAKRIVEEANEKGVALSRQWVSRVDLLKEEIISRRHVLEELRQKAVVALERLDDDLLEMTQLTEEGFAQTQSQTPPKTVLPDISQEKNQNMPQEAEPILRTIAAVFGGEFLTPEVKSEAQVLSQIQPVTLSSPQEIKTQDMNDETAIQVVNTIAQMPSLPPSEEIVSVVQERMDDTALDEAPLQEPLQDIGMKSVDEKSMDSKENFDAQSSEYNTKTNENPKTSKKIKEAKDQLAQLRIKAEKAKKNLGMPTSEKNTSVEQQIHQDSIVANIFKNAVDESYRVETADAKEKAELLEKFCKDMGI